MDLSSLSDDELLSLASKRDQVDRLMPHLIHQESGGRAGVVGPQTRYGQAEGMTQMLPATAEATARKLGVPWRPELMRGTSPEAADYQRQLGEAYLWEGLEATGNERDALRYYHGGPNREIWGPKTEAYADSILGRAGSAPDLSRLSDDELLAMAGGGSPNVEVEDAQFTSAPAQPAQPPQQNRNSGVVYQGSRLGLPDAQYQYVRGALTKGEFDRSARPGTRKLPFFQQSPNDPVPDAAYWVDLAGNLHEPKAAPSKHAGDPAYQQARGRIAQNQQLRQDTNRKFGGPFGGALNAIGSFTDQVAASTGAQDEVNAAMAYLGQGAENLIRRGFGKDVEIPARTAARAAADDVRDRQKVYRNTNPNANMAATGLGIMASGRPTGGQIIAQRPLVSGAQAATLQAPFALARQEGTLPERLPNAALETAATFGLASAATAGANALQRSAARAAQRPVSDARTLSREGIRLTPGQMAGGIAQRTEDALTSAPMTGMAINARRAEGLDDFNRVAINRGLAEIGETLPQKVTGRAAIKAADKAVSQVYDDALRGVTVAPDQIFAREVAAIQATPNMPAKAADDLNAVVAEVNQRMSGPISGNVWKEVDSTLATAYRAADRASANDVGARYLREAIGNLRRAHKGVLERAAPAALEAVERADAATANLVRVREASTKTAARKGVFTAPQLNQAVRQAEGGARRAYRQGDALMQDLTDAAVSVLPQTIPDSGTALRLGAIGALGGASTINPIFGQALMADAAGATLYSRPVQAAINAIYRGTDPVAARAALAQLGMLASRDPALLPVYEAAARQAVSLPQQRGGLPGGQRLPQVPMIPQAPTR